MYRSHDLLKHADRVTGSKQKKKLRFPTWEVAKNFVRKAPTLQERAQSLVDKAVAKEDGGNGM